MELAHGYSRPSLQLAARTRQKGEWQLAFFFGDDSEADGEGDCGLRYEREGKLCGAGFGEEFEC